LSQSNIEIDLFSSGDAASQVHGSEPEPTEVVTVPDFPSFRIIEHGSLYSISLSANTNGLTHGLHRFPAKYIPQIPRWALREFASKSSVVLDPFAGSGTTLVESRCAVDSSIGIDIDPLARLIASAKVARYDLGRLRDLSTQLLDRPPVVSLFVPMQGVVNFAHWFNEKAWRQLCGLYEGIQRLNCDAGERRFFLCVFSSILRRVSNADDQTQKTYVSGTLPKTPAPVMDTFRRALTRAVAGVEALHVAARPGGRCQLINGSASAIPLLDNSVDLVITSPPYVDSVDYMYNLMVEYFWLGPTLGVNTRAEFNSRRRATIGAKNPARNRTEIAKELADLVTFEDLPQYRRAAVSAYFESMARHFFEAARVLRESGRYVLVIGNSQASAGAIPVHDCLVRLASNTGLSLQKAFAYRIRRHYMKFPRKGRGGIILMDWVIVLGKAKELRVPSRLPMPAVSLGKDEVAN